MGIRKFPITMLLYYHYIFRHRKVLNLIMLIYILFKEIYGIIMQKLTHNKSKLQLPNFWKNTDNVLCKRVNYLVFILFINNVCEENYGMVTLTELLCNLQPSNNAITRCFFVTRAQMVFIGFGVTPTILTDVK